MLPHYKVTIYFSLRILRTLIKKINDICEVEKILAKQNTTKQNFDKN